MHEYTKLVACLPMLFLCVPADAMAQAAGGDSGSVRQPPTQVAPVMRELAVLAPATPVEIATQPVTVTLAIPSSARPRMAVASAAPAVRPTLMLTISDIMFDRTPDAYFEVYLDLPSGETPNYKSDHFIGNLSFFGLQSQSGGSRRGASFTLDMTRAVRALQSRGLWKEDEVTVTFVPTALEDNEGRRLPVPPEVRVAIGNLKIVAATAE